MSCLDQHSSQADQWASDDISDDEKYNPTHAPPGTWMPKPETILALFERLEKDRILPLKWQSPGRRPPSSQRVEEPMEEEPSPVQEREPVQLNIPIEPTEFDFDDASTASSTATIARRQTPGSSKTPSRFQRVARMDKVLEDVMKQRKQSPARSKISSPRAGMMSKNTPARGQGGVLSIGTTPRCLAPVVDRSQSITQSQRKEADLKTRLFAEKITPHTALIDALRPPSLHETAGDRAPPYSTANQPSYSGINTPNQAGVSVSAPVEASVYPGLSSSVSVHHPRGMPDNSVAQMAYVTASSSTQRDFGIASTASLSMSSAITSASFADTTITTRSSPSLGLYAPSGLGMVSSTNIRFTTPQILGMGVNKPIDARPRMNVSSRSPHSLGMAHSYHSPRGLRMSVRAAPPISTTAEYVGSNISDMNTFTSQMYYDNPMPRQKSPIKSDSLAKMTNMAFQNPAFADFCKTASALQKEVSDGSSVAYVTKHSQFITNTSASFVTAANLSSQETKSTTGFVSNLSKEATRSTEEAVIKPPPIPSLRISLTTGNDPKAKPTFIAHQVVKSAPKSPVLTTLPQSPSKRPPPYASTWSRMEDTVSNSTLAPPIHVSQSPPVSMTTTGAHVERSTSGTASRHSLSVLDSIPPGSHIPHSMLDHIISATSGPRMSSHVAALTSDPPLRPNLTSSIASTSLRGQIFSSSSSLNSRRQATPPMSGTYFGGHLTPPMAGAHGRDTPPKANLLFGPLVPPTTGSHWAAHVSPHRSGSHLGSHLASSEQVQSHVAPPDTVKVDHVVPKGRMNPERYSPLPPAGLHTGGHFAPPLSSAYPGGHTTPPIGGPHLSGYVTPPGASPHRGYSTPPRSSPHPVMTPPRASPHRSHATPPRVSPDLGGPMIYPGMSANLGGHVTPPVVSSHLAGHVTPVASSHLGGHVTPPVASPHLGGHVTPPVVSPHLGGHVTPPVASSYLGGYVTPPVASPHLGGHVTPPAASPRSAGHITPTTANQTPLNTIASVLERIMPLPLSSTMPRANTPAPAAHMSTDLRLTLASGTSGAEESTTGELTDHRNPPLMIASELSHSDQQMNEKSLSEELPLV